MGEDTRKIEYNPKVDVVALENMIVDNSSEFMRKLELCKNFMHL